MLSRVAERLYWMARYLERVENTARLVGVYGELLLDMPEEAGLDWSLPLTLLGQADDFSALDTGGDELHFLLLGEYNPGSLIASLGQARENARTTRDLVPLEAWRGINELHLWAADAVPSLARRPTAGVASELVSRCHLITGILEGTMSHGPAYRFVQLGRCLERADMTTRMIDVAALILMRDREELNLYSNGVWRGILRALSAYQMYQQYVRRRISGPDVVAFLLLDADFPRAVRHCVNCLDHAAASLPRHMAARVEIDKLADDLAGVDPATLDADAIHRYVDGLQIRFGRLHDAIFETWLNPMRIGADQPQQ